MEVIQLLISGISQGCVYGLIALGFVLIYKATEMVNFAQGDMMMIGAFVAVTFINILEWPFVWGLLATVGVMAVFGVLLERLLLRPMIGEPKSQARAIEAAASTRRLSICTTPVSASPWPKENGRVSERSNSGRGALVRITSRRVGRIAVRALMIAICRMA